MSTDSRGDPEYSAIQSKEPDSTANLVVELSAKHRIIPFGL